MTNLGKILPKGGWLYDGGKQEDKYISHRFRGCLEVIFLIR